MQNRAGYLNLCELITRAYLENPHRNRAEVRTEWFEEGKGRSAQGLIALSGARYGAVGSCLLAGKPEAATLAAQRLAAAFDERFYLELQRTGDARDAVKPGALSSRLASYPWSQRTRSSFYSRVSAAQRAYIARSYAERHAPAAPLHARAIPENASRNGRAVCRCAGSARELGADRQALQPDP